MSTRFPEKGTTERVECPLCGAEDILNTGLPDHMASDECGANESDQSKISDYNNDDKKSDD